MGKRPARSNETGGARDQHRGAPYRGSDDDRGRETPDSEADGHCADGPHVVGDGFRHVRGGDQAVLQLAFEQDYRGRSQADDREGTDHRRHDECIPPEGRRSDEG